MRNKDEIRAEQIDRLSISVKGIYQRAFSGSKASSVKAKCLECCCDDRAEVRDCQVYTCPLFEVRPYQVKKGDL